MNNDIRIGRTFADSGIGACVIIDMKGDRFIAMSLERLQYVTATDPVSSVSGAELSWNWGHYTDSLQVAARDLHEEKGE